MLTRRDEHIPGITPLTQLPPFTPFTQPSAMLPPRMKKVKQATSQPSAYAGGHSKPTHTHTLDSFAAYCNASALHPQEKLLFRGAHIRLCGSALPPLW